MKIYNNLVAIAYILFATNSFSATLPNWINDPYKECGKNNICAVGTGTNNELASTTAKNNILKYFSTKISSNFSNKLTNDNNNINETTSEIISEKVDGILKGVEIIKTFNKGNTYYALASLDKTKTINEIRSNIRYIDAKMLSLIEDKTLKSNKELEKLFNERMELNKQYLFLTDREVPETVSYEDIKENNKKTKKLNSFNYFLKIKDDDLKAIVKELISENNGSITNIETESNFIITGKITSKKEFLAVNGFEKYSITVELSSIKNKKIVATIKKTIVETGLSFEQIYKKSLDQINDFIFDNFVELIK